jgi:pyruvate/2-oxoglutarate/acetoin dehydrogenase E1 component
MARNITYREALNEALTQEMERDETVIVMAEDNAGGAGAPGEDDAWGGVLGVTKGLYHKFPAPTWSATPWAAPSPSRWPPAIRGGSPRSR